MNRRIDLNFGQYYEGETKNDRPDGHGTHHFPDGSRYAEVGDRVVEVWYIDRE